MKKLFRQVTSIVLPNLFIITTFNSCSENTILNGIPETTNSTIIYTNKQYLNNTIIWHSNGISITAKQERFVWADLTACLQFDCVNNILIKFDAWTNADSTDYVSLLKVDCGLNNLLYKTGGLFINGHHILHIENFQNDLIRFYISLWTDDARCGSSAILYISNVRIYRY